MTNFTDAKRIAELSKDLGEAMVGINEQEETYFGTIPMCVKRNAYGRQLGSFFTTKEFEGIGEIPMTFIRAPYVESVEEGVKVLAEVDGNIVGVEYGNQIGIAFHPELDDDLRVHKKFVSKL